MVVVTELWWGTKQKTEAVYHHCYLLANAPANLYVGVNGRSSELTLLVQYLLANLTGSIRNITQENCQSKREDQDDKESKDVRLFTIYRQVELRILAGYIYSKFLNCTFFYKPTCSNCTISLSLYHVQTF